MIEKNKQKFKELLLSTKRSGMENVLEILEKNGFFEAPASTKYHGDYDGGLCEHCLNVYNQAMYIYKVQCKIRPSVANLVSQESVVIASLLHDVCKYNIYKKTKKWRKNEQDKWEQYDAYEKKQQDYPVGHGEKSVILLLSWGLELHENEVLAIRWHMGNFDISTYGDAKEGFNVSGDKNPLVPIIMCADILASRITEVISKNEEKI